MNIALITARLVAGAVQAPFYGHTKFTSKSFGVRLGHAHLCRKRKRMGNRRVDLPRDDGIAANFAAINLHPIT